MINVKFKKMDNRRKVEGMMELGGEYRSLCTYNPLFVQLVWVVGMSVIIVLLCILYVPKIIY